MDLNRDLLRKLPRALRIEIEENALRKDLTQSELGEQQERILAPLREHTQQGRRTDLEGTSAKSLAEVGRPTKLVGKLFGESHTQVEKRLAVVAAAEAEPERFGKLAADMDRCGRVNGPYRRLCNIRQAERIRAESPPLAGNGPYRGGFIDVAHAYEPDDDNASERGVLPYSTMTPDEAAALDIRSLLAGDAVIGMWETNFTLVRGLYLPVYKAWGVEPKTIVTWPKERAGRGHWAKGQTEHLIIAVRGKPTVTLTDQTTLLKGPFHLTRKGAHSAKPIEAYAYFESLFPAPRYFDLFSRYQHSERWDCWGDEAPGTVVRSYERPEGPEPLGRASSARACPEPVEGGRR